jgi:hypothetical protein
MDYNSNLYCFVKLYFLCFSPFFALIIIFYFLCNHYIMCLFSQIKNILEKTKNLWSQQSNL